MDALLYASVILGLVFLLDAVFRWIEKKMKDNRD